MRVKMKLKLLQKPTPLRRKPSLRPSPQVSPKRLQRPIPQQNLRLHPRLLLNRSPNRYFPEAL